MWTESLEKHADESWITVLSDLQPETHVCHKVDHGRNITINDCTDAWTLFNTDRSQVCPGNGPEPARCGEEIGRATTDGDVGPSGA